MKNHSSFLQKFLRFIVEGSNSKFHSFISKRVMDLFNDKINNFEKTFGLKRTVYPFYVS